VLENEEKTWLRAKNTYMFRPRQPQMNKRPASKVPLQTELRFPLRTYEQPHSIGGPAEQQKTDERHVVTRSNSGDDDDFCSGGPNSSSDDLRADAAARRPPPVPKLVRQGRAEGRRVGERELGLHLVPN
jgi:hypothetical protein